jgi:hypothetical protein
MLSHMGLNIGRNIYSFPINPKILKMLQVMKELTSEHKTSVVRLMLKKRP